MRATVGAAIGCAGISIASTGVERGDDPAGEVAPAQQDPLIVGAATAPDPRR